MSQPDTNSNTGTLPPPPPPPPEDEKSKQLVSKKLESITESIQKMTKQLDQNNNKIRKILEQKVQACTRIEGIKKQINDSESELGDIAKSTIRIVDQINNVIQSGKVGADQDTTEITTLIAELKRINEAKNQMEEQTKELKNQILLQQQNGEEQNAKSTQILNELNARNAELQQRLDDQYTDLSSKLEQMTTNMTAKDAESTRIINDLNYKMNENLGERDKINQDLIQLKQQQQAESTLVNKLEEQIDALKTKVEEQSDLFSTSIVPVVVGEWREYLGKNDGGVNDNFFQDLRNGTPLSTTDQGKLLQEIEKYILEKKKVNLTNLSGDVQVSGTVAGNMRSWNTEQSDQELKSLLQDLVKKLQFISPLVEGKDGMPSFPDAIVHLYLLIKRSQISNGFAQQLDKQKWLSALTTNMIKLIKDNLQELPEPLKGLLTELFKKPDTKISEKPDTKSGGKRKRSIKKKRQPKKNITIKKKYKKNKKMPKKKIKKKHTIHKKRRNNKNKTLRRRK